jgi:GAF domain-containing protein/HAMP domain-containing protein
MANDMNKTPNEQRLIRNYKLVLTILAIFAVVTSAFYLIIYATTQIQQSLIAAGLLLLAAVFAPIAYLLIKRGVLTIPGIILLIAVAVGYGGNELAWKNLLPYHIVGGLILITLTGNLVLPRKPLIWMFVTVVYTACIILINLFEPLPRFDQSRLPVLLPYAIGTILLLVLALIGLTLNLALTRAIRTRLLIYFALLVLTPMVVSGIVLNYINALNSQQNTIKQLESVTTLREREINAWLDSLKTVLPKILSSMDQSEMMRILRDKGPEPDFNTIYSLVKSNARLVMTDSYFFDEISILNLDGKVVFSTNPALEGVNRSSESYFHLALTNYVAAFPDISPTTKQPTFKVAMPILGVNEDMVGLIIGQVNFNKIHFIMQSDVGLENVGGTYLIINRNGMVLASSRPGFVSGDVYQLPNILKQAVARGQNGSGQYPGYQNATVLSMYRWLPSLMMLLVIEQNQNATLAFVYQTVAINAGVILGSLLLTLIGAWYAARSITTPIDKLAKTAEAVAAGNLKLTAAIDQEDEIGALAKSFNSMTTQLSTLVSSLEERIAERTKDLERRSTQLQVAAEVARDASATHELDVLLNRAVNLVRERFGFYHAGIFMVDEAGEYAVLKAATGEAGRAMLEQGHSLKLGDVGMVGYVAAYGQPRIALDVGEEATHFKNPLLPETHSEIALPLKVGQQVIGVLDIQSQEAAAFTQDDVIILQTLADQLAVAIDNARLFQEAQESLQQVEMLYGEYSQRSWRELVLVHARGLIGYQYDQTGVNPVQDTSSNEVKPNTATISPVMIPLKIRGQVIANLKFWPNPEKWSDDNRALLEAIGDRVSQALESARLYQDSQRNAARDRLVSKITDKMRRAVDMDTLIQTAVQEMATALGVQEAFVQFGLPKQENPQDNHR